jgi:hypothetical protein
MNLREKKKEYFLLGICIGGMAICALLNWRDGVHMCAGGSFAALAGVFDD